MVEFWHRDRRRHFLKIAGVADSFGQTEQDPFGDFASRLFSERGGQDFVDGDIPVEQADVAAGELIRLAGAGRSADNAKRIFVAL